MSATRIRTASAGADVSPGPWVSIPGARLSYSSRGEGVPVLFLHEPPLDRRQWEPQSPLAERWRMVCVDLRGYGRSSPPGDVPYSHSDDLSSFLDALGLARAAIVGAGSGGGVALRFTVEHPGRVAAIALLGPSIDGVPLGPELAEWSASLVPTARDRGMSAAIDTWMDSPLLRNARRLPGVEVAVQRMARDFDGAPWLRADPVTPPPMPTLSRLGEIRVPACVLVGEHDHADYQRMARTCAEGIPGAELRVVRGAGHLCGMEAPASVNGLLERFLGRMLA